MDLRHRVRDGHRKCDALQDGKIGKVIPDHGSLLPPKTSVIQQFLYNR
jgi:hypothetical protein